MRPIIDLNLSSLPPELRLILACLRASPNDADAVRIERLSRGTINWESFLAWVDHHHVAPLVYLNLRRFSRNTIPEGVHSGLRNHFERNAQGGLALAAELVRLLHLLKENRIPALVLKGPVLALQLYGNLAWRHAGDIDLLVAPHQVDQADRLLRDQGYRRISPELSPRQQTHFKRLVQQFEYYRTDSQLMIDLHWRLLANKFLLPLDFGQLWSRRQSLIIAGYPVPAMSRRDLLLFLSVHGAHHAWYRLFWLNDLAEVLRQDPETDWSRLMADAAKLGALRSLAQGVVLAHLLLDAPLPELLRAYAVQDRKVLSLVEEAFRYILMQQSHPSTLSHVVQEKIQTRILYDLKLLGDSRYKIEVLTNLLLMPVDWETVRLPDSLFPLYYLLRPLLFVRRYLRGGQGH